MDGEEGGGRKRGRGRDGEIEGWRRRDEKWTQSQILGNKHCG